MQAYRENVEQNREFLAWVQINIMNRLRWSRKTPRVTMNDILGREPVEFATKEELLESFREDERRRDLEYDW